MLSPFTSTLKFNLSSILIIVSVATSIPKTPLILLIVVSITFSVNGFEIISYLSEEILPQPNVSIRLSALFNPISAL